MRKWNAILSALLIAVFLLHGVIGGFLLLGVGKGEANFLAWIGCGLIAIHVAFGVMFTVQAIRSGKASGKWYLRQNALFWARRISGVCILVLAFFHFRLFGAEEGGRYVLFEFTTLRLIVQLLLTAALFTHIFMNIRPLLVSFGILKYKKRRVDIYIIVSVALLFCTYATIFYYVGWLS
ncbi:MAG: pilus assembly protein PilX [Clostridiales Family XIII bacterium]|jgi:succinate dehydrogenase/fumarate reductase cytochrome b subunit|nr:pilus assembly protein PilX [Clostridiales Family XIII bacterium]